MCRGLSKNKKQSQALDFSLFTRVSSEIQSFYTIESIVEIKQRDQAIFHQHQPMVSMHLSSFSMPVVAQITVTFYYATGP